MAEQVGEQNCVDDNYENEKELDNIYVSGYHYYNQELLIYTTNKEECRK